MRKVTNASNAPGESRLQTSLLRIKHFLLFTILVTGLGLTVPGAAWHLDPTFGVAGKVLSDPDGTSTFETVGMVLQADGKIVIVGNRMNGSVYNGMILVRYNADGSPDTDFGNNGWTSVTFGGVNAEIASSVALQADGKIVLGGSLHVNVQPNSSDLALARFNSNGTPDTSFDTDGKLVVSFNDLMGPGYREVLSVVKIASDGKIVVAGVGISPTIDDKFIIGRFNPDGSPDTSFGTNGKFADVSNGPSNQDKLQDMIVLPDGKIVIVGYLFNFVQVSRVARQYSAAGVKEWSYQAGANTFPGLSEGLYGIAALPDGKFIVVGEGADRVIAIRLNANGTVDPTFINQAGMFGGRALSVVIQPDGKIVANIDQTIHGNKFQLVRWNADGSLDTGFGSGGYVVTTLSPGQDNSAKLVLQPDGKLLLAGTSFPGSPSGSFIAMARYKGSAVAPDGRLFDYDGDGRADVSVFRPSSGFWYLNQSADGIASVPFGVSTDKIAPADYDGDQKTDVAVYRDGTWWILQSSNSVAKAVPFGLAGDTPQAGDFDNDGKDDLVLFRPSNNNWYVLRSSDNGNSWTVFGATGDIPLSGDYDGDGKSDLAIYRPSTGAWWYAASSAGGEHRTTSWGLATDRPAPADYDGDGKTDFAVYRPADGLWFILNSGGASPTITNFGLAEDRPVPADYDGDGKADIAVFRPSTGIWYLLQSTAGFTGVNWGVATDVPTQAAFTP